MTNFFSLTSADSIKVSDGTDQANINAEGIISKDITYKSLTEQGTGSFVTQYTVPAGKIVILKGIQASSSATGKQLQLKDGSGTIIFLAFLGTGAPCSISGNITKYTAGETIDLYVQDSTCWANLILHEYSA